MEGIQTITPEQIKQVIQGGQWVSITTEPRPSSNKSATLVKIEIKGHNAWGAAHPIAPGAYNLDYIADEAYEVTPLHQGFADVANRFPAPGLTTCEVNVMQDLLGKAFP
jgi:hypothetical protein